MALLCYGVIINILIISSFSTKTLTMRAFQPRPHLNKSSTHDPRLSIWDLMIAVFYPRAAPREFYEFPWTERVNLQFPSFTKIFLGLAQNQGFGYLKAL